jgi:hypothetical protein
LIPLYIINNLQMKPYFVFGVLFLFLTSCTQELHFTSVSFEKKSKIACQENCPKISIKIPVAQDNSVEADSINKKVFSVLKEIVYFGEKPYAATNYKDLTTAFIDSYEKLHKDFPSETIGWEATVTGKVRYQSEGILNLEINHYTYTGGAHGYQGLRSLLFDPSTGKTISNEAIFKDKAALMAFAEKKFRAKYKIPSTASINATGLMFEEDKFALPQNIFYTDKGLLLYYNSYEAASYADGPKELLLSYATIESYLKLK